MQGVAKEPAHVYGKRYQIPLAATDPVERLLLVAHMLIIPEQVYLTMSPDKRGPFRTGKSPSAGNGLWAFACADTGGSPSAQDLDAESSGAEEVFGGLD